jgi:hypothetical protein
MKSAKNPGYSGVLLGVGLYFCACVSGTDPVSVNERIYEAHTMTLVAGGCVIYDLANPDTNLSTSGGFGTLRVHESIVNRAVNVDVMEADRFLISRRYEEPFLRSETPDEFSLTATSGSEYRFRYWGSPDCTGSANNTP